MIVNQDLYSFRITHDGGLRGKTGFYCTKPVKQGLQGILEHSSEEKRLLKLLLSAQEMKQWLVTMTTLSTNRRQINHKGWVTMLSALCYVTGEVYCSHNENGREIQFNEYHVITNLSTDSAQMASHRALRSAILPSIMMESSGGLLSINTLPVLIVPSIEA